MRAADPNLLADIALSRITGERAVVSTDTMKLYLIIVCLHDGQALPSEDVAALLGKSENIARAACRAACARGWVKVDRPPRVGKKGTTPYRHWLQRDALRAALERHGRTETVTETAGAVKTLPRPREVARTKPPQIRTQIAPPSEWERPRVLRVEEGCRQASASTAGQ